MTLQGPGDAKGSKSVTLPPMGQIQDMLVFMPQAEGEGDYSVRVPVESEEVFSKNNERSFHLSVRKEILKVLVVDSEPRWEFRYLRNALMRDPGVAVNAILFNPQIGMGEGTGYLSEFPAKREDLQAYDVVFLGDIGIGQGMLSPENASMLKGLIEQQASGLVFLPGPLGREKSLADSALADLIPVEMDYAKGAGFASAGEARMDLTLRGRDHWLTMLATDPEANQAVWRGLPGFNWYAPVVKAKPGRGSARGARDRTQSIWAHSAARHAQRRQREGAVHGNGFGMALAQRRGRYVPLPLLGPGRAMDGA